MSVALQTRRELAAAAAKKRCCKRAEFYGMLLFAASFRENSIKLQTEDAEAAKRFLSLANTVCGRELSLSYTEGAGGVLYSVWAEGEDAAFLLERMGHGAGEPLLRLRRENLAGECCRPAFLRGAFLAGGSVSAPKQAYHLEIATPHAALAEDFARLLEEIQLSPLMTRRKGNTVLYFKNSEEIFDFLTVIGAPHAAMELMNLKIERDIRNNANRVANCETANIAKTTAAGVRQREAIRKIERAGLLDALPAELRSAAKLRLENPDCSLAELCGMIEPRVSKSGLNHRLAKLVAIADELHE